MGIDASEIDDQFARLCSSHPPTGPQPGLGTSTKVSSVVFMNWKSRKHEGHQQSMHGKRQVFNKLSAKKARQLQYLSRNQLRIMTELQTGHCHLTFQSLAVSLCATRFKIKKFYMVLALH
jgi:hypothetical protein